MTWYWRVRPPQELTSLTPLTERSRARISQSCSALTQQIELGGRQHLRHQHRVEQLVAAYAGARACADDPVAGLRDAPDARLAGGERTDAAERIRSEAGVSLDDVREELHSLAPFGI